MNVLIFVLQKTVMVMLDVLMIALFARAIFSWMDPQCEWGISNFLFMLTEPVIFPLRQLFARMHWFEGFPLDMPFMFTWLLLSLAQILLSLL